MPLQNAVNLDTITVVSADKTHQDGVRLVGLNKPYIVHEDPAIGKFIIGARGVHGVIDMRSLKYYETHYGWDIRCTYSSWMDY